LPSADSPTLDDQIIEKVEAGEWLDLIGEGNTVDTDEMRTWGEDRVVSAKVLRDIVRGAAAANADPRGLRLRGARVRGELDLAFITSRVPVVINDCVLDNGVNAFDAHLSMLDLEGCLIEHPTNFPVFATGLTCTLLSLRNTTINSIQGPAAVVLFGAVLGELDCWGATITNPVGIGLAGEDLRVHQKALMGGGFAVAANGEGAVVFSSAEIGEVLFLGGSILHNKSGMALCGESLRVHRKLLLRNGFRASGAGVLGAVNLDAAELGELDCTHAVLTNETGPAFSASDLHVRRDAAFNDCMATGGAANEAVSLAGADLGDLSFRDVVFRNETGGAFDGADMHVHRDLFIRDSEFRGGGPGYTIDLTNAAVDGDLVFSDPVIGHEVTVRRHFKLDGFTYPNLPVGISHENWLTLLGNATSAYAAQPYQHLAAVHRAAGHDSQARRVLIAQRRDQLRRRALTGRGERAWVRFTGLALGYGYQPWRALVGLLLVVAAAVILAVVLGGQGGLASTADPTRPCAVVERVGVGLDLGTPLLAGQNRCATTTSGAGQVLDVTGWILRLFAWGFATLFIAGFTTAVRRT
jgi:hypothetical protein